MSRNETAPKPSGTRERVIVNATPEHCFAIATDFENYPAWSSDIRRIDVLRRDDRDRAVDVAFWAEAFGRSTTYRLAYDYEHAPHALRWHLVEGDIENDVDGEYSFEPFGEQTELVYRLDVELKVPMPSFVRRRAENRIVLAALHQLKARAES